MPETVPPARQPKRKGETAGQWTERIVADLPDVPDHSLGSSPVTTAALKDLHARLAAAEARLSVLEVRDAG
jgi:hypothetical protein